jgi:hypothetical protein
MMRRSVSTEMLGWAGEVLIEQEIARRGIRLWRYGREPIRPCFSNGTNWFSINKPPLDCRGRLESRTNEAAPAIAGAEIQLRQRAALPTPPSSTRENLHAP